MGDTDTIDPAVEATSADPSGTQPAPAEGAPRDESGRFAGTASDPAKQAEQDAQKAGEAADKAAFEAATKGEKFVPGKPAAKKPETKAEDADEPKADSESKDPPTKAEGKPATKAAVESATPEDREKVVVAQRALRRDGWTDEEIADLKPAKLLDIGIRRALAQAKTDKRFEQLRSGSTTEPEAPTDGDDDAGGTQQEAEPDLDELLAQVTDPEAKAKAEETVKAAKAAEARAVKAQEQANVRIFQGNLTLASRMLVGDFPGLKTDEGFRAVLAQMDRLDPGRTHALDADSLAQLMRDAAYIAFGPQLKAQARKQAVEANHRQRDGQPDTDTGNARPQKRLTDDERDKAAYDAALATPDRNESQKLYRQKTGAAAGR